MPSVVKSDVIEQTIYGVPTKRLNEQVTLTAREKAEVVANCDHLKKLKFTSVLPRVFTEHGTIMVANILNSKEFIV